MNMTCKMVMDLVELYKEGIVSRESAEAIREHLKTCPECRSCYQNYDSVKSRQFPRNQVSPPEISGAASRCYEELSRRMRKHHYMRIAGASAAIGAGSIMLMIGIALTCKGSAVR